MAHSRICHCLLKFDDAYVDKSSLDVARYHICQQPGQLALGSSMAPHAWVKHYMSWISGVYDGADVYAWSLPEATSTTVVPEICTACEQPAVDDP